MTSPVLIPFLLHFLAGVEGLRDVKAHTKRRYGWLPNGRSKRRSKKRRGRKGR